MSSSNNRLNSKKGQQRRSIHHDGRTAWDHRPAGSDPISDRPDWIKVPPELRGRTSKEKLRGVSKAMEPCPKTGNLVPCLTLENGWQVYESPGQGWVFSLGPPPQAVADLAGRKVSPQAAEFVAWTLRDRPGTAVIVTPDYLDQLVGEGSLVRRGNAYHCADEK